MSNTVKILRSSGQALMGNDSSSIPSGGKAVQARQGVMQSNAGHAREVNKLNLEEMVESLPTELDNRYTFPVRSVAFLGMCIFGLLAHLVGFGDEYLSIIVGEDTSKYEDFFNEVINKYPHQVLSEEEREKDLVCVFKAFDKYKLSRMNLVKDKHLFKLYRKALDIIHNHQSFLEVKGAYSPTPQSVETTPSGLEGALIGLDKFYPKEDVDQGTTYDDGVDFVLILNQ